MTEITSRLSTALADRYQIERHLGEGEELSAARASSLVISQVTCRSGAGEWCYLFDGPARCPECRSTALDVNTEGSMVMYD